MFALMTKTKQADATSTKSVTKTDGTKSTLLVAMTGKASTAKAAEGNEPDHYDAVTPSGVRIMVDSVALIQGFDPSFKKVSGNGVTLCFERNRPASDGADYAARARAHAPGSSSSRRSAGWSWTRGSTSARYAKVLMPRASHVAMSV